MEAWVTLATNDSYAVGAMVLATSLRRTDTTRKLVILTTSTISSAMSDAMNRVFDEVVVVEPLDSGDVPHLTLLERPELGITFTKIHCWTLTKYTKCVFLDADTLVLSNCDDLFSREEFSAAPDAGWPDCFNSGVFVFRPNLNTFKSIVKFAGEHGSFDGGDQGLLNHYFSGWATEDIKNHLPFTYNMCATSTYTYLPAYKFFGADVKIIHFIGTSKPWHVIFNEQGEPVDSGYNKHTVEHLKLWWNIFSTQVHPRLGAKSTFPVVKADIQPTAQSIAWDAVGSQGDGAVAGPSAPPPDRREAWEQGTPDFSGTASFDNILKKIESTMSISSDPETPEKEASPE